jgi:hypothetical protein
MNKVNGISLGRFLLFYHRSCSPCLGFFTLEVKVKPRSRYPPINLTLNTNHLESPSSSNQSHHPVAGIIFRIPSSLRLSVFLVSSLLLSHTLSLPAYLTDPSSAALESHGDETTYQPLNSITFSGDIAIMSTSPSDLSEGGGAPLFSPRTPINQTSNGPSPPTGSNNKDIQADSHTNGRREFRTSYNASSYVDSSVSTPPGFSSRNPGVTGLPTSAAMSDQAVVGNAYHHQAYAGFPSMETPNFALEHLTHDMTDLGLHRDQQVCS